MSLDQGGSQKPVSEYLAEVTGRPVEEFEYDGEIPELDELEWVPVDEE